MPELPEVETVRRGLEPVMVGAIVENVAQRRPDLRFPFPENFPGRLVGQRVTALNRRAKYLLAHLSGGEVLIMHLGMSGRFTISHSTAGAASRPGRFVHAPATDPSHDHVVLTMSSGAIVKYNDPRRFGFMELEPEVGLDASRHFAALGIEPLGNALTAEAVATMARGRKTDLKAFLLDQRNIAGLGNIYVCEALYRARLSPRRQAGCLATSTGRPTRRTERLVPLIRTVLQDAIDAGGSSLRDYAHTDGSLGYFQHAFRVYDREGRPCATPGCGAVIARLVQSGRSTFMCPHCQR